MKKLIIALFVCFFPVMIHAQTKDEMKAEIQQLRLEVQKCDSLLAEANIKVLVLETRLQTISVIALQCGFSTDSLLANKKPILQNNENKSTDVKQCKAITATGTQCSRKAAAGSDFCWQHNKTVTSKSTPTPTSTSTNTSGRTILTGSRGGQYYINSKGNKTYIKK